MQELVHINKIDNLCCLLGILRIPSNYNDSSKPEQEYYYEEELFLAQRKNGTPMRTCVAEMRVALLPDYYG